MQGAERFSATTTACTGNDGRNQRIVTKTYASGLLDEVRHAYYTEDWQLLEERLATPAANPQSLIPAAQFVWGVRYTDDLVLRDRDADESSSTGSLGQADSGLEERRYAMQDANWNVVAIADTSGAVQERYVYSAYGTPKFLTSAFVPRSPNASGYAWESLFTGRQHDAETGLYHYRRRPYAPALGRFLSQDPVGYEGGDYSLYRYVFGGPLGRTDANGLQSPGGNGLQLNPEGVTATFGGTTTIYNAWTGEINSSGNFGGWMSYNATGNSGGGINSAAARLFNDPISTPAFGITGNLAIDVANIRAQVEYDEQQFRAAAETPFANLFMSVGNDEVSFRGNATGDNLSLDASYSGGQSQVQGAFVSDNLFVAGRGFVSAGDYGFGVTAQVTSPDMLILGGTANAAAQADLLRLRQGGQDFTSVDISAGLQYRLPPKLRIRVGSRYHYERGPSLPGGRESYDVRSECELRW